MDSSYEGTPARFVSDPRIMQQGYVTNEPYVYEQEIAEWGRPVGYQKLADYGYSVYPSALSVRADRLVDAYQTGWAYSAGVADFAVQAMREQGLVTDDPASGVFGQFDPARMEEIVSTFGPILQEQGAITEIPDRTRLYTNEFIDPSIRTG